MNISLFKRVFLLLFTVGVLNLIGAIFYLHWALWWYDVVLHFLAGGVIAMTMVLFLQSFFDTSKLNPFVIIFLAVLASALIGVIWEIYELCFGMTFLSDGIAYVRDTASDLIIDTCGGLFGVLYARRFLKKNE